MASSKEFLHFLDKIFSRKIPWSRNKIGDRHRPKEITKWEYCKLLLDFSARKKEKPLEEKNELNRKSFSFTHIQQRQKEWTSQDRKIPMQRSSHIHGMSPIRVPHISQESLDSFRQVTISNQMNDNTLPCLLYISPCKLLDKHKCTTNHERRHSKYDSMLQTRSTSTNPKWDLVFISKIYSISSHTL